MCSLDKTLLAYALLHFVLQKLDLPVTPGLLISYFCITIPYDEKDIFFLVLDLEGIVGLHRTSQRQLLWH